VRASSLTPLLASSSPVPPQVPSWGLPSPGAPPFPGAALCPAAVPARRAPRSSDGGGAAGSDSGSDEITAAFEESEAEPGAASEADDAPDAGGAGAGFRVRWCVVAPRVTAPAPGQPAGLVRAALWAYEDWDCSQPRMQVGAPRGRRGRA
jgi:hypothetical protein